MSFSNLSYPLSFGRHTFYVSAIARQGLVAGDHSMSLNATNVVSVDGHAGTDIINHVLIYGLKTGDFMSSIAMGAHHLIWSSVDGLYGYGHNDFGSIYSGASGYLGQPIEMTPNVNHAMVVSGETHVLLLDLDGQVSGWGGNEDSQIQVGGPPKISTPSSISFGESVVWIGACGYNSAYLTRSGQLHLSGRNASGQLGQGHAGGSSSSVLSLSSITHAAIGVDHGLAISNGQLYDWGSNGFGQLGVNTPTVSSLVLIDDSRTWVSCYAGGFHSFAVDSTGQVFAWGKNNAGQLGLGHESEVMTPSALSLNFEVEDIRLGYAHTVFLAKDGSVYSCGSNRFGQLGRQSSGVDDSIPLVINVPMVSQIGAGPYSCSVQVGADFYQWGKTPSGALAFPTIFFTESEASR